MILVDTSIWIDHFRRGRNDLIELLVSERVSCHEFVIGELTCGHLRRRAEILTLMAKLPRLTVTQHDEVLHMLESHRLMGVGLGWIDAHLLASALLAGVMFWTLDDKLMRIAEKLGVAAQP